MNLKYFSIIILSFCTLIEKSQVTGPLQFDEHKSEYLYHFACECIDQEYPNKLNGVLGDDTYLSPPRALHPAFYGCFDWHSSVHSHWTLLTILREFPDFKYRDEICAKLNYPIRIGEHNNTAFGMSFAYDYAKKYDPKLAAKIEGKAKQYFINDSGCPLTWEPGKFDFLSPCLQEATLMQKVLPEKEFKKWLKNFLPDFEKHPEKSLEIAIVSDRSDGKLAHLEGLNFSRAWCLFEMGKTLNNQKMIDLGIQNFNYSYEKMDSGEYAGAHWLASFALYALKASPGSSEGSQKRKIEIWILYLIWDLINEATPRNSYLP